MRGGDPQQLLSLCTAAFPSRNAPCGAPSPHGHQRGRGPHGAGQGEHQVPPAAVAQGELDLDVLQRADALGPPRAGGGVCGDGELGADVPARYKTG